MLDIKTTTRPGPSRLIITKKQLEFYTENGFNIPQISDMLHVSERTIKRRLKEFDIMIKRKYSEISESDLDEEVLKIIKRFLNTGYKKMKGFLLEFAYKKSGFGNPSVESILNVSYYEPCNQEPWFDENIKWQDHCLCGIWMEIITLLRIALLYTDA